MVAFKVVGTAAADTVTIPLKTILIIGATGDVTFTAATKKIERASGSWLTDGVTVGSVLLVANSVNKNNTYVVKTVTTLAITVENDLSTYVPIVDEVASATFGGSYKSDFLAYGQIITGTPKVNIPRVRYSVSSGGDVAFVRNSVTVLKLFGHDEIECLSSEENASDITVTFETSAGGTAIIECSKIAGFGSINPKGMGEI